MAEKEKRDWSIVAALVVVGVPVAIYFALAATVLPYWRSGRLEFARLVATPDGDRMFILEEVVDGEDSMLDRLTVYDLSSPTAKPVATYTRQSVRFEGVAGGHLWFSSHDASLGWHARDPVTLAVTVTQADLAKRDERLRRVHEGEFVGDGLRMTTLDGYELFVDAATLTITDAPKQRRSYGDSSLEVWSFTLADGRVLGFDSGSARTTLAINRVAVEGSETWLEPRFVLDRRKGSGVPVSFDDPESYLIVHKTTVASNAPLLLSRITTRGKAQWTRALDDTRLMEVGASGDDTIAVAASHSIRSIYAEGGTVAVQHDLD